MRVGGTQVTNCTLDIPGYGKREVSATTLGYGLSIAASVGESRHKRTFYPFKKTSGTWYIEAAFTNVADRDDLHKWLITYIQRATDQWESVVMAPITVMVPSRDFIKTGYPVSSFGSGDSVGMAVYRTVIMFTSASDPLGSPFGSIYAPPMRDGSYEWYPAADPSHFLPSPLPSLSGAGGPDEVWNSGGVRRF